MSSDTIFRISFVSQGEIYEIFARGVGQGNLFGFVEVEELVFGEITTGASNDLQQITKMARSMV